MRAAIGIEELKHRFAENKTDLYEDLIELLLARGATVLTRDKATESWVVSNVDSFDVIPRRVVTLAGPVVEPNGEAPPSVRRRVGGEAVGSRAARGLPGRADGHETANSSP